MDVEPEYEVKFHLYDGNEKALTQHRLEYEELREQFRTEGSVMSKVLSYFFEGLIELIDGDIEFWKKNFKEAYTKYTASEKMLHRFSNSRNVEVRLDLLTNRLIDRVAGLKNLAEGFQMSDLKIKISKFSEALNSLNSEVQITNKMKETMSSYAAFARASFAESQLLMYSAEEIKDEETGKAKTMLMSSRNAIRQAAFIDPRYIDYLDDIEDNLDDLTKNRLLIKAESFGDIATLKSENGNYLEAKEDFKKASLFYKRASSLAGDTSSRRYLLSSATIYEASELEAEGNHLFRRENETAEASVKFEEAAKQVDKAIALMGRFGSKSLEASFASQRDYYRAMSIQSGAINLLDQEQYAEAKLQFEASLKLFTSSEECAKAGDNPVIVALSEEAKGDIQGYISMCETLI